MKRTEHLLSRITINPKIMLGKPTIRDMRITVEQILRALSAGISESEDNHIDTAWTELE